MINLLPPEIKSGYRYARRNVTLRRWVAICLVALVGLAGLATYGLVTLHQSTAAYNDKIAASKTVFGQEKFSQVQNEVKDESNSFKLAVKVLGQEVLFSKLIQQITSTIPDGANLTGLDINQTQGGIDIAATATDYAKATQVQVNLADPANKTFSKADIVNVSCNSVNATDPRYPCLVTIRALFDRNNPFLFINSKVSP